eukprot:sb/3477977/
MNTAPIQKGTAAESPGTRSTPSTEYTPSAFCDGTSTFDKLKKHTSWNPQLTTTIDQPPFYKKVLWYSFDHVKEALCGTKKQPVIRTRSYMVITYKLRKKGLTPK